MNKASSWRMLTAKKITKALMLENIEGIILGGSTSNGWADDYSDIEIGLIWKKLPTLSERKQIVNTKDYNFTLEDIIHEPLIDFVFFNGNRYDGLKIDLIHCTLKQINDDIDDVLNCKSIDPKKVELLYVIKNAKPLHNENLLINLQNKINDYPKNLKVEIIVNNLRFNPHFGRNLMLSRTSMIIEFHNIINTYIKRIINILSAINEMYQAEDFKWLDKVISNMKIKPANLYNRINSVLVNDNIESIWNEIESLISDVIKIVEKEMPEIDILPAKDFFLLARKNWKAEPKKA